MKKTIGGDRLGSGKKMQVELHGYERSTHDLGYLWRSTMSAGTLVPFMSELALPGDTFDINLDCDIKTHPTIGPLFGSYKVQLDVFQAPLRLYHGLLHNNALGIGLNMKDVVLPKLQMRAIHINNSKDPDNAQINPSCIFSYLGIRGIGQPDADASNDTMNSLNTRSFNAVPYLAYWEIYKNYYANKQEEIGAAIHTPIIIPVTSVVNITANIPDGPTVIPQAPASDNFTVPAGTVLDINYGTGTPNPNTIFIDTSIGRKTIAELCDYIGGVPNVEYYQLKGELGTIWVNYWEYMQSSDVVKVAPTVQTFPLENIDKMRNALLGFTQKGVGVPITENMTWPDDGTDGTPYIWPLEAYNGLLTSAYSQEGLAIKTYQSDLFNNWLQTEWIDGTNGINKVTAIDTSTGEFTLDTLNLAKKVYDMLNRIAISGGTYDDWLDTVYGHERYVRCESPMYMGGLIKELVFQEVISNAGSETADGAQPLGTLAGRGVLSKKHKGGYITIKVDEPSYIIGIISLTPRVDYSQGNKWDIHLDTMDDLHKPGLDEIGFQELITEQMAWWDTKNVDGVWVTKSAGKQPAWLNYMTNVNQVRGNFAIVDNEMFMTLNRRYEKDSAGIKDLTTYIDPAKFNFIFAQTSLDAQNFWAQIAVDITARRKMSAKVMPNL